MVKQIVAVVLCGALVSTGCASAAGPRIAQAPPTPAAPQAPVRDNAAMADYVQRLAPGTMVRVEQTDGTSLRGTLLKASPQTIVVQKNTRVPEPPIEVPLDRVARVTIESHNGSSIAKNVAIGVGTGVAVVLGIFGILVVIAGGD